MLTPSLSDRIFHITALGYMLHYEGWVRERFAPGRLLTISADTGSEHKETREHARYLEAFYASVGEHWEHVTADKGHHTEKWRSLEHFYSSGERRRIGSKSFKRSCTWQLKLSPFYKRLEALLAEEYGVACGRKKGLYEYVAMTGRPIRVLLGISAEEAERRIDPDDKVRPFIRNCIERVYPLDELGMTREDCREYIRSKGHPVPFPSLCTYCPFHTARSTSTTRASSSPRSTTAGSRWRGTSSSTGRTSSRPRKTTASSPARPSPRSSKRPKTSSAG